MRRGRVSKDGDRYQRGDSWDRTVGGLVASAHPPPLTSLHPFPKEEEEERVKA